jgi:predicted DNA-binding transcriptional regulator
LLSIQSSRGHDMGWIGVTLDADSPRPPAGEIRERIEKLVGHLTKAQ